MEVNKVYNGMVRCASLLLLLLVLKVSVSVSGQCPWSRSSNLMDLHSDCICGYNNVQRLSIQCSPVNFTHLMTAIHISVQKIPIDMLYINNSTLTTIPGGVFKNLDLLNLHISNSRIESISNEAFIGLEDKLITLTLENTFIQQLPHLQIQTLRALKTLDLSNNRLHTLPDNSFANMQLTNIRLSDNDIVISDGAFRGLESTLKNLNLKATNLKTIPKAIQNLSSLAFLDLAQNKIKDIDPDFLINLHSLTAINLERNQIQRLHERVFMGINDSLSSLSLLNNLLVDFPSEAISKLTGLRVLDLGFNGIREIPTDAFRDNSLLTLLALDGNPLKSVPFETFEHLNNTLRGLSIGGKYLECDCKLRWIVEWINDNNLQVTSRERNPQFCGKPDNLKKKTFFHINQSELICDNQIKSNSKQSKPIQKMTTKDDQQLSLQTSTTETTMWSSASSHIKVQVITDSSDSSNSSEIEFKETTPFPTSTSATNEEVMKKSPLSRAMFGSDTIKVIDAIFHNNSISIEWEPIKTNNAGYQVVYRFFGSKDFKKSPLMPSQQRRYKTSHIPSNECIVICVLSLDDHNHNKLNNIPLSQCREIRRDRQRISDLDKIVIGLSAAVCVFVVIAVFVFSCCYHKSTKASKALSPITKSDHEWETVSVYSARSIPRARMYHMDSNANHTAHHLDETRSHISNCYQSAPNAYMKHRSIADGQSNRSYSVSQLSNRLNNCHSIADNAELMKSQQSLAALSAHPSYTNSHKKHSIKSNHNRLISTNSLHSLTEYDSDWNYGSPNKIANNWKDNELDIYVDQNYVMTANGKNKYRK